MNETIIEYDNKKLTKSILLGILLIVASVFFLYLMVFITRRISLPFAAVCVVLFFMSFYLIYKAIKQIRSKDRIGLILNDEGCFLKLSKVGIVSWNDVSSIYLKRVNGTKQVFLRLVNPDRYVNRKEVNQALKKFIIEYGVAIPSSDLSINIDELHNLIEKYFESSKRDSKF